MGMSFWHLLIIVLIVLLLFGPNRLPSLGKSLGEAIRGFKKGLNDGEIDVTDTTRHEQIRSPEETAQPSQTTNTNETNKNKV